MADGWVLLGSVGSSAPHLPFLLAFLFRRSRFLSGRVSSHPEERSAVMWFPPPVSRTFSFPKDASPDAKSRLAVFCHVCAMYVDVSLSVTAEKQFPGI